MNPHARRSPSLLPGRLDDYTRASRCSVCLLTPALCVCAELPRIELPERFVVIRHCTELDKHSNTGGLVPHLLTHSRLLEHGVPEGPFDPSCLTEPDVDYQILYPGAQSTPVTPTPAGSRPRTIILLDGTWRKARRMLLRIPVLRGMPLVHLPDAELPETPRLRKPPTDQCRFTLEAVCHAVAALGHTAEAAELTAITRKVMERRLHGRGKIGRDILR